MAEERISFSPCSEEQRDVLMDSTTDILLVGGGAGGGKTRMCLTKCLSFIRDKNARVIVFRQTQPQLKVSGGIIDESHQIFPHVGGEYKVQQMKWVFDGSGMAAKGATVQFAAIPDDAALAGWQGSQLTHIIIDEAAEWTEKQVIFLLSRLRSATYNGHLSMTLSCNPNKMSFLRNWLDYCINKNDGIPMADTSTKIRWFVSLNGSMYWGDTKEELYEKWGDGKTMGVDFIPKSFRFCPLTIYSNKVLLKKNPEYLASLLAQSRVDQDRFLHGSWDAVASSSGSFKREWVEMVDYPPEKVTGRWRGYDLAASLPSEVYKDPDWTVGVLLSRTPEGYYTIEDMVRFRARTDEVLRTIASTAADDGVDRVRVAMPRDPGQAGLVASNFYTTYLSERGVIVSNTPTTGHSSKMNAILPFFALCEAGMVRCVKADWNNDMFNEFEIMDGSRKNKDDICDATSLAFKKLAQSVTIPTFSIPVITQSSPIPRI